MNNPGTKAKLPVKKHTATDLFGNRQKIPAAIAAELEKKNLVGRFVNIKTMQENGGFHKRGWEVYELDEGLKNPITGNVNKTYRVGDLILAVKTKEDHQKHREYLDQQAKQASMSAVERRKEIRDRIKENKAEGYVKIFDGYEENE